MQTVTVIRSLLVVTGIAILGAIIGAVLGYLVGMAYVILADVSPMEGLSGMMVFYGFVPLGALLGMVVLPVIFAIWQRTRRRSNLGLDSGPREGLRDGHDHRAS
jgi:hypothetical protein